MALYSNALNTFPTTIKFASGNETTRNNNQITQFLGDFEERTRYSDLELKSIAIKTPMITKALATTFVNFWSGQKSNIIPFIFDWMGTNYYMRFDGTYTITWTVPENAQITFTLKEVHPSEIIVI